MKYVVNRDVTKEECPWLDRDIPRGLCVYSYEGITYGCIGPAGVAVTIKPDEIPFFELPKDALTTDTLDTAVQVIREMLTHPYKSREASGARARARSWLAHHTTQRQGGAPMNDNHEIIARTLCESRKFETGQGTCAAICMEQLGDVREKGCAYTCRVHNDLASKIIEALGKENSGGK